MDKSKKVHFELCFYFSSNGLLGECVQNLCLREEALVPGARMAKTDKLHIDINRVLSVLAFL
jgi:hypothetical protein